MTALLRVAGVAATFGIALGALAACSAADRAIFSAPRCTDAEASPSAVRHQPGQAILMSPLVRSAPPTGPILGWENVVSVADGGTALAAVHSDGTVSVVGTDHLGSLAGTAQETLVPLPVPGVTDAVAVSAVGSSFLVTHTDGTVTAWGEDMIAGGGRRDTSNPTVGPTRVDKVDKVVAVADGSLNVLALRSDGGVIGWGINLTDILGDKDGTRVRSLSDAPGSVSVANPSGAAVVATGAGEVCAWGNNVHGLLGVEPRGGQTPRPVRVGNLDGVTQVAGGLDFALAVNAEGTVWGWGRTVSGMLGDGSTEDTALATPQRITGLPPIRTVYAADSASYGITATGELWAWGCGRRVEPYTTDSRLPRPISLPGPAQEVSGSVVLIGPPA